MKILPDIIAYKIQIKPDVPGNCHGTPTSREWQKSPKRVDGRFDAKYSIVSRKVCALRHDYSLSPNKKVIPDNGESLSRAPEQD